MFLPRNGGGSTNKAFTSLNAMMERCRTIYLGRFPNADRQGFGNSRRIITHKSDARDGPQVGHRVNFNRLGGSLPETITALGGSL